MATQTSAPKTYAARIVTIEDLANLAKTDSSFASRFNGIEVLTEGQVITFPNPMVITSDTYGPKQSVYYMAVSTDDKEIAFSQFLKQDYVGNYVNPAFAGKGIEWLATNLAGKTLTVQKTIANMATFTKPDKFGNSERVTDLSCNHAPKAVNYFIIAGMQDALAID